jgi:hypothetical protein
MNNKKINNKVDSLTEPITEQVLYQALTEYIQVAGHKFEFGYFTKDDLLNEGWIILQNNIHKYNPKRGVLKSFISTLLGSRFRNIYRQKCRRTELPCYSCKYNGWDKKNQKCILFENMMECHLYRDWFYRNNAKANLLSPEIIYEDPINDDETPLDGMVQDENFVEFKRSLSPSNLDILDKLIEGCQLHITELESLKEAHSSYKASS